MSASYTVGQAANLLGVKPATIYKWIAEGQFSEVKLWKVNRRWRIDSHGLHNWLSAHTWEG